MIRDHRLGELLDLGILATLFGEAGELDVNGVGGDGDVGDLWIGEILGGALLTQGGGRE